jgi:hypothetical protein
MEADEKGIKAVVDAELLVPSTQANKALVAVNEALKIAEPIAIKFGDAYASFQKNMNYISEKSEMEKKIYDTQKILIDQIIKEGEKKMLNEKTTEKKEMIFIEIKTEIEKILNKNTYQKGGKKILSRTNKSISQFLNSKVTFKSILKRMTSKYKKGGKRVTKRHYKR